MGYTAGYIYNGVNIPFYNFSPVGNEKFGYSSGGEGDNSGILNALNGEVDILIELANSPDITTQEKLDLYQYIIEKFTEYKGDLAVHDTYWYGKKRCCPSTALFKNCVKKCGHSRKMINWVDNSVGTIYWAYYTKLNQFIDLLEQENANLSQDLNNQQLVAQTNIQIAQANELLLAVQLTELEVRERNTEMNIRTLIIPIVLFGLLAFMYYRAFVKK